MRKFKKAFAITLVLASALISVSCSHAQKKTTPELSQMEGKKVALVDIDGEESSRAVVEVALVNQLLKRGTFYLVSKQDVDAARNQPDSNPLDWKGIAKKSGADYALRAKVLQFDGNNHEGYSSVIEEDSQLAAEQGESARKSERLVKVRSLEGVVKIRLEFANLATGELRSGLAEKSDTVQADEKDGAVHLPLKLNFLEKLANEAFRQFFEQYN